MNNTRSRGFTIVEVLIALVVTSVGMLGIAGLYITTLRTSGSAINRMHAINLAGDIADRIRANRAATVAYAGATANNNCYGGGSVNCTPAQLAAHDLLIWNAQVAAQLPGGTTAVAVNNATFPVTYNITVRWNEPTYTAPLTYVLNVQI